MVLLSLPLASHCESSPNSFDECSLMVVDSGKNEVSMV